MREKFAGSEWLVPYLEYRRIPQVLSPLGIKVADILGQVYQGLYHLEKGTSLTKPRWSDPAQIDVILQGEVASFDDWKLTGLLVLCHDAIIRLSIRGVGPNYLRLRFSQRLTTDRTKVDVIWDWHPTLEENISQIREHFGLPNQE
jgi:hypothetical protein